MKGLQLTDTNIVEMRLNVPENRQDTVIKTLVAVEDDTGEVINYESIEERFIDLSVQRKAALNNYMRLASKEYNNSLVNENKESWVDI